MCWTNGEAPVNQSGLSLQVFWETSSPAEGFERSERLVGGWRYLDLDLSIDLRSLLSMSSFLESMDLGSCRRFSSPSSSDLISELTEEALWPWRPADRAAGKKQTGTNGLKAAHSVHDLPGKKVARPHWTSFLFKYISQVNQHVKAKREVDGKLIV